MRKSLRYNNRASADATFFVQALTVSLAAATITAVGIHYELPERIKSYWRGEPYKKS